MGDCVKLYKIVDDIRVEWIVWLMFLLFGVMLKIKMVVLFCSIIIMKRNKFMVMYIVFSWMEDGILYV